MKRHFFVWNSVVLLLWMTGGALAKPPKPPKFHAISLSAYSFDDTVNRLKKAIEEQNMMVIKEINPQQMLRMIGVQTKGMKQLLFFSPRFMKEILETNKNAALEPPLKLVIMEKPDGKVVVKYIKPTYLFGRYEGLEAFGKKLEKLMQTLVSTVTK